MSEITEELKPCPFCGGEAERFTIGAEEPNNAGGDVISCTRCEASSHVEFGRKENLVSRWNTRAASPDQTNGLLREALERLVFASGKLVVATDEMEMLRPTRQAVLDAVRCAADALLGNRHAGHDKSGGR